MPPRGHYLDFQLFFDGQIKEIASFGELAGDQLRRYAVVANCIPNSPHGSLSKIAELVTLYPRPDCDICTANLLH